MKKKIKYNISDEDYNAFVEKINQNREREKKKIKIVPFQDYMFELQSAFSKEYNWWVRLGMLLTQLTRDRTLYEMDFKKTKELIQEINRKADYFHKYTRDILNNLEG